MADTEPGPSWEALLGEHQEAVDQYIQCATRDLGPAPSTAVLFCDQNKAFERMSLQWMGQLTKRWQLPSWLLHS
eukprot:4769938-Pyramimonas_sp.AAC.1